MNRRHGADEPARRQDAAKLRLDALLMTNGLTRGSREWRELGQTSTEVDRFLNGEKPPKASKKPVSAKAKKRRPAWTDPGSGVVLKTADDTVGTSLRRSYCLVHAR